jgi:hypothetical protein
MFLSANAGGSLSSNEVWVDAVDGDDVTGDGTEINPFQNICAGSLHIQNTFGNGNGATIWCEAGDYDWTRVNGSTLAATTDRWITVTPAAGVARADVTLIIPAAYLSGSTLTNLTHLKNVTINTQLQTAGASRRLWLDECHIKDFDSAWSDEWYVGIFATDCIATNAGHAFIGCDIIRNAEIIGIVNDSFPACRVVINSIVSGQDAGETGFHSDVWQPRDLELYDNIIIYGLLANIAPYNLNQGFMSRTSQHTGIAFVECNLDQRGYPEQNALLTESHHLYMVNNTFVGTPMRIGLTDSDADVEGFMLSTNVLFARNVWQWVTIDDTQGGYAPGAPYYDAIDAETVAIDNHFINQWPAWHEDAGDTPFGVVTFGTFTTGLDVPDGVGAGAGGGGGEGEGEAAACSIIFINNGGVLNVIFTE